MAKFKFANKKNIIVSGLLCGQNYIFNSTKFLSVSNIDILIIILFYFFFFYNNYFLIYISNIIIFF